MHFYASSRILCKFPQFHHIKLHKYAAYFIAFFKKTYSIIKDFGPQQSQKNATFFWRDWIMLAHSLDPPSLKKKRLVINLYNNSINVWPMNYLIPVDVALQQPPHIISLIAYLHIWPNCDILPNSTLLTLLINCLLGYITSQSECFLHSIITICLSHLFDCHFWY